MREPNLLVVRCYAVGNYGRARGYCDQALHVASEIQDRYLTAWNHLTWTQVLTAAGELRAGEILTRAHTELMPWAANCLREETRHSLLENAAESREKVHFPCTYWPTKTSQAARLRMIVFA